jgi:hypothetical protein
LLDERLARSCLASSSPPPLLFIAASLFMNFTLSPDQIIVDGVYSYQTSIGLASGQVPRRSQGTLLPLSVNPRYQIRGTNV